MKKQLCLTVIVILLFITLFHSPAYALETTGWETPDSPDDEPLEDEPLLSCDPLLPPYSIGYSIQWSSGKPNASNKKTHGFITEVAYNLLCNSNSSARKFYSGNLSTLMRGSVLPDDDETNNGYAWHFYGPNGLNYLNGSVTAYSKCVQHYNAAVRHYKLGRVQRAMEELGRALHYLQDVNAPHHAMNAVAVATNHIYFEAVAENVMRQSPLTGLTNSVFTNANYSVATLVKNCASTARSWYKDASASVSVSGNVDRIATAAKATLRNAERATATLLYKFMLDVR